MDIAQCEPALQEKYNQLLGILKGYGSVAIAFSGGVDSTFLLRAAHEALGENVIAVTAVSGSFPEREFHESEDLCRQEGVAQYLVRTEEMTIPGFRDNPPNRCYLCKKAIFTGLMNTAAINGITTVCEGTNMDDEGDYRPGMIAIRELGIKSPLREAGLNKQEIRSLSNALGLPTWSKPSYACLATRFPYYEPITTEKLHMVEQAEQYLFNLGFQQVRVRIHGTLARIEALPADMEMLFAQREAIHEALQGFGFSYVALDLKGYRTGSMNETLKEEEKTK